VRALVLSFSSISSATRRRGCAAGYREPPSNRSDAIRFENRDEHQQRHDASGNDQRYLRFQTSKLYDHGPSFKSEFESLDFPVAVLGSSLRNSIQRGYL